MSHFAPLVNVAWLSEQLNSARLVLLDASMAPPGQPSYQPGQVIAGARRFDFDQQVCDPQSTLPHMMPTPSALPRRRAPWASIPIQWLWSTTIWVYSPARGPGGC